MTTTDPGAASEHGVFLVQLLVDRPLSEQEMFLLRHQLTGLITHNIVGPTAPDLPPTATPWGFLGTVIIAPTAVQAIQALCELVHATLEPRPSVVDNRATPLGHVNAYGMTLDLSPAQKGTQL